MSPSVQTIKKLFAYSRNRCAFTGCDDPIVDEDGVVLGEVCHIKGEKLRSPRHDKHQSDEERHGFGNLILLCANHHTKIDKDWQHWSVEKLVEMKRSHEAGDPTAEGEDHTRVARQLIQSIITYNNGVTVGDIIAESVHIENTVNNVVNQVEPGGASDELLAALRGLVRIEQRASSQIDQEFARRERYDPGGDATDLLAARAGSLAGDLDRYLEEHAAFLPSSVLRLVRDSVTDFERADEALKDQHHYGGAEVEPSLRAWEKLADAREQLQERAGITDRPEGERRELDRRLYQRVRDAFEDDGLRLFIESNGDGISAEAVSKLREFMSDQRRPDRAFLDERVEAVRKSLLWVAEDVLDLAEGILEDDVNRKAKMTRRFMQHRCKASADAYTNLINVARNRLAIG